LHEFTKTKHSPFGRKASILSKTGKKSQTLLDFEEIP
jgi:hypothetical protein